MRHIILEKLFEGFTGFVLASSLAWNETIVMLIAGALGGIFGKLAWGIFQELVFAGRQKTYNALKILEACLTGILFAIALRFFILLIIQAN